MNVVVHLAQHPEPTGQQCLRCGELLFDAMPYIEGRMVTVAYEPGADVDDQVPRFFPCGSHVRVTRYADGTHSSWHVTDEEPTCDEKAVVTLYGYAAAGYRSSVLLPEVTALSAGARVSKGAFPAFTIDDGLVPGQVIEMWIALPGQHHPLVLDINDVTLTEDTKRVKVDVDDMRVTAEP